LQARTSLPRAPRSCRRGRLGVAGRRLRDVVIVVVVARRLRLLFIVVVVLVAAGLPLHAVRLRLRRSQLLLCASPRACECRRVASGCQQQAGSVRAPDGCASSGMGLATPRGSHATAEIIARARAHATLCTTPPASTRATANGVARGGDREWLFLITSSVWLSRGCAAAAHERRQHCSRVMMQPAATARCVAFKHGSASAEHCVDAAVAALRGEAHQK
jgi:hypothetical protein